MKHLEPQAAIADVRADGVTVWVSTQTPVRIRTAVAKAIDRKEDEVIVKPVYLGGGVGRKIDESAAVEAARLSAAIGKPVHIGWNRSEDFLNGFMRPPTHNRLLASVDNKGFIQAIEHQQASGEVAFPFFPDVAKVVMGADFGSWRGAYLHYAADQKQTTTWLADLPVPTGWWRGLGVLPNVFAIESFIDELAHSIGMDPLEFRILNRPMNELGDRVENVLKEVAKLSSWYERNKGIGKGIAWSSDVNTVVAEVAEIHIEEGIIKVDKIYAVVDPGLVISPDGAKAQALGAITMGLSAVLKEKVTLKNGKLVQTNFHNYPLLTMQEAPEIEIKMISSGETPFGMGEPPIAPVGAAVANAVFDLTGKRIRQLPLKLS
ncbi:MAG: xanthine dehydrogenase family protein molybdopterin-binding subunit [Anaerolineae bacterium]|nr:xanthine dehydrogenase family protein molybdopterin-binding subunit [Anaerolineae bacterium]